MSDNLIDPNQPAHAIVEVYDNGGAKRNDGSELKPANANPWYVLATIHGEQDARRIDWELHAKNRRIWNGWMGAQLASSERNRLAEQLGVDTSELAPLNHAEQQAVKAEFLHRLPGSAPPDPMEEIDCSGIYVSTPVVFLRFVFPNRTVFAGATFSAKPDFGLATFNGVAFSFAIFSDAADFESATFSRPAIFRSATFSHAAIFANATFSHMAIFANATFGDVAVFQSATFSHGAVFQSATFIQESVFQSATFSGLANFSDGAFQVRTDFTMATFRNQVPKFFQRELHQDTVFPTDEANWPRITSGNAADGKRAYTRLRQLMNELHKPDDEHFFFRQEMRCNAYLERWPHPVLIWLYEHVAGFGYSVIRPAGGLLGLWFVPALIYLFTLLQPFQDDASDLSWPGAFGLSFANLFAFFGLNGLYFEDVIDGFGPWLSFLAGFQTVTGFILVFFLGLGLRNRFRLK